tara:strand:- start:264 stop:473 length:210 start_codon:yes stop_codon:yes gene_type:complete
MKLTESKLRRIILEEQARLSGQPIKVTPAYINMIIKEELELHRERKLQEAKRIQETARKVRRARRNNKK